MTFFLQAFSQKNILQQFFGIKKEQSVWVGVCLPSKIGGAMTELEETELLYVGR